MLLSMAYIFILGMFLGSIFERIKLPRLLGMLLAGIILGPSLLDVIDASVLAISGELRRFALSVILLRAGLGLEFDTLKEQGRPVFFLSFLPASLEILGIVILAPLFFKISYLDAAILGSVVAAVSPAVVVPRMLDLIESRHGEEKGIPQMIMTVASLDDIFVIIVFTSLLKLAQSSQFSWLQLISIPSSIIFGVLGGLLCGKLILNLFKKVEFIHIHKIMIILSLSFLLLTLEDAMTGIVSFSGLLAIMAMGGSLKNNNFQLSRQLSLTFSKIWSGSEILLFVLVGISVDLAYALGAGMATSFLIIFALSFRVFGVFLSLRDTNLNLHEKLFTGFSLLPKATVQASIGAIPLALGLASGELILTIAALSIIITAPLGAILMDATSTKFLRKRM